MTRKHLLCVIRRRCRPESQSPLPRTRFQTRRSVSDDLYASEPPRWGVPNFFPPSRGHSTHPCIAPDCGISAIDPSKKPVFADFPLKSFAIFHLENCTSRTSHPIGLRGWKIPAWRPVPPGKFHQFHQKAPPFPVLFGRSFALQHFRQHGITFKPKPTRQEVCLGLAWRFSDKAPPREGLK